MLEKTKGKDARVLLNPRENDYWKILNINQE